MPIHMHDWEDFDYVHFNADTFLFEVIIDGVCDDVDDLLENVLPTEENYQSIRDALLYSGDAIEYVYLLVSKYGTDKIRNDKELYNKLYDTFEKELLDRIIEDK